MRMIEQARERECVRERERGYNGLRRGRGRERRRGEKFLVRLEYVLLVGVLIFPASSSLMFMRKLEEHQDVIEIAEEGEGEKRGEKKPDDEDNQSE